MTKNKYNPRIVECEGRLYLPLNVAGIHWLCCLADGVALSFFGRSKKAWIDLDTAIEWHQRESQLTSRREKHTVIMENLVAIKEKYLPMIEQREAIRKEERQ
jgi:hypothetical protein